MDEKALIRSSFASCFEICIMLLHFNWNLIPNMPLKNAGIKKIVSKHKDNYCKYDTKSVGRL
jgi:hypothetical protein